MKFFFNFVIINFDLFDYNFLKINFIFLVLILLKIFKLADDPDLGSDLDKINEVYDDKINQLVKIFV